ncbi:NAD(+)/NADH kinase [Chryseobacterium daecheongense]|uniref:ATP-NAD kinase n=1 Tax=Chryseobacterium daecheongense TaxID=192389 RepID=A0A3N0VTE3_9FLAO|nr:NAD(+)/NADH kinase [Chryseobacterium daecheongense]ROH96089.1 sugar kinase [Chryseobacterium daecheongense]TDX91503.1 ATP-NAD kinase [Chryseobacterium daecheongense]
MKPEYAIIVKNKTRLESLIERFNTKAQAQFYIESSGGNFREYVEEHERFYQSFMEVQTRLSKVIKNKVVEKEFVPSYIFSEKNLIIVIGQDGLVANVAKYSKHIPIIAINPDEERYDGVLLPFTAKNFLNGVNAVINESYRIKKMRFAEAVLNDGQKLLAVNDLFIGISSHSSARYKIMLNGKEEVHSSSGIIVSTKTGSTGWLSSIFNMAYGILGPKKLGYPTMSEEDLYFAVREPFKSIRTQTEICGGKLKKGNKLIVESLMPNNGFIFSDGIEQDFLQFNSGATAEIKLSDEEAVLVTN